MRKTTIAAVMTLLALFVLCLPASAQQNVNITVTNSPTTIVASVGSFYATIKENSATPTAVFTVNGVAQAAGSTYAFSRNYGNPMQAGQTIGTIVATTSGPFTFVLSQYPGVSPGGPYPNGGTSSGGAPSGPAGGTVCGTFPNPGCAAGPILNVIDYGASPSLADNATAFAASSVAFNAVSQLASNPTMKSSIGPAGTPAATCTSCTSLNPSFTIAPGDVVFVIPVGALFGRTVTVTDSGGNVYTQFVPVISGENGSSANIWATPASGATAAATSITMTESGAAAQLNVVVISFNNVGSYRFLNSPLVGNAGSTTASINQPSTLDNNNILLAGFGWYQSATVVSAAALSGTIQQTFPSSNTVAGGAVVTLSQASPGSTTDSVTLNHSAGWTAAAIELRSRTLARPILYIPPGVYNYSSGLSFTQPGTLMCTPGSATLNYIGSAHAVDFGATLTNNTLNAGPIGDDGCDFTGGAAMTEGLTFNAFNVLGFVRNSTFRNFGNSTSHMIDGKGDNWDLEIGPQNRFFLTDMLPRMIYLNNQLGTDQDSFTRFHDNLGACWQGDAVTTGCTAAQAGVGIIMDGAQQRFFHNNLAFWSPDIRFICTNGSCFGNQADENILESSSDAGTANVIQFGGTQVAMLVTQNAVNQHSNTSGFIGPVGGSDTMSGARINFNTIGNIALATPVVKLNNLSGQTANFSYSNNCGVATTAFLPCAKIHTTGGSINQWNADNWLTCTMSSGTCTATFSQTYASAPKCTATWNGTGTLTGVLEVVPSTTNVVVTSSVGSDTDAVQINCSAGDSQ